MDTGLLTGTAWGALPQRHGVRNRAACRLIRQMLLFGRHILIFQQELVRTAHGDHRLAHSVLHAFDQRGHPDQTGDAQDDAEHGQQRTGLVRPDFLEPDEDGVDEVHPQDRRYS